MERFHGWREYFHRGIEFKNGKIIGRLESNFSKFASHGELSARREGEISLKSMKDRARQSSRHGKVASIQWNFSTSDSRLRDLRVFDRVFLPIDGNVDRSSPIPKPLNERRRRPRSFLPPAFSPVSRFVSWNIGLAIFATSNRFVDSFRRANEFDVDRELNNEEMDPPLFSSIFFNLFLDRVAFDWHCIANLSLRNDTRVGYVSNNSVIAGN